MARKMHPQVRELERAIAEILWREWNPIAGGAADNPRDEYSPYVPQVLERALADDRMGIAEYLSSIEANEMGLGPLGEPRLDIADSILRKKAELASRQVQSLPLGVDELRLIANALNEILHGPGAIEEWEFGTRIGATRAETQTLLQRIGERIDCSRTEK